MVRVRAVGRLALCVLSIVHYAIRLRTLGAYRVQVRLGFTAVVALGLVPGLEPVLHVPLLGTSAQLLFGCCPMARLLDLAPWNRTARLDLALVWDTATRPSGDEGLLSIFADRADFPCHPSV